MRPKTGIKTISFEVFQRKFLYSVILMNRMQNALEANHDAACRLNGVLTDVFQTPDGINVQIKAENIKRGKTVFPVFKMLKIIE